MPDLGSLFVLCLALTAAACSSDGCTGSGDLDAATHPVVETDHGPVRGVGTREVESFRGIPYAAPPVDELRFRAPRAPTAWEGVRDATAFGSPCPQQLPSGQIIGDEDCLTLNVWRPSAPATQPRPVLVFIHGGANVVGSASDLAVTGRDLARDHDLVVVTFNYRLGPLGFLAHPELTAESGTSGNWAYLDQIAALDWVARNIAAFGGDPEHVTISGLSAGALSVCVLLATPLAAGKFDAAIMQSGGCDVATLEQRELQGKKFAAIAACAADPVACLRSKSAAELAAILPPVLDDSSPWVLPVGGAVDGVVLPASPWDRFAAGTYSVVPTMVGTSAAEASLFVPESIDCAGYEQAMAGIFGSASGSVLAEYPCTDDASARAAYVDVITDRVFSCQARRVLRSLATASKREAEPLFRYYYSFVRSDPAVRRLGAYHGAELQMLFGTLKRLGYAPPEQEQALSEIMQASWAALASEGSPIHAGTPGWDAYDVARDNAIIFDWPVAAADAVGSSHCDFWDARPDIAWDYRRWSTPRGLGLR